MRDAGLVRPRLPQSSKETLFGLREEQGPAGSGRRSLSAGNFTSLIPPMGEMNMFLSVLNVRGRRTQGLGLGDWALLCVWSSPDATVSIASNLPKDAGRGLQLV